VKWNVWYSQLITDSLWKKISFNVWLNGCLSKLKYKKIRICGLTLARFYEIQQESLCERERERYISIIISLYTSYLFLHPALWGWCYSIFSFLYGVLSTITSLVFPFFFLCITVLVCSAFNYGFRLPLWYRKTFLTHTIHILAHKLI
jgi:hypothetical protein